jgi:hypothetical protein
MTLCSASKAHNKQISFGNTFSGQDFQQKQALHNTTTSSINKVNFNATSSFKASKDNNLTYRSSTQLNQAKSSDKTLSQKDSLAQIGAVHDSIISLSTEKFLLANPLPPLSKQKKHNGKCSVDKSTQDDPRKKAGSSLEPNRVAVLD